MLLLNIIDVYNTDEKTVKQGKNEPMSFAPIQPNQSQIV
jgi:hypothetical protein